MTDPKEIEEIEEIEEIPKETPKPKGKPKKVNIMSTDDSHEPPKKAEKVQELDLSPIIEEIKSGFASMMPKEPSKPDPKPDPKKEETDFLSILGSW